MKFFGHRISDKRFLKVAHTAQGGSISSLLAKLLKMMHLSVEYQARYLNLVIRVHLSILECPVTAALLFVLEAW